MEPTMLIALSASAAAGALLGFVGGKRSQPEAAPVVPAAPAPPDPRVESLLEENALLRRISGVEDIKSLPRDPRHLGPVKDMLNACLADVLSARGARSAAFFDEEALVVAGDASDEGTAFLGHFLASVRPAGDWQRVDWRSAMGESVVYERLQLGRKSLTLGVLTKGDLPDSALARVRFAFEGLRVLPSPKFAAVDSEAASLQSVERMLKAKSFGGVIVIDGGGKVLEKVGLPPTTGADQTLRELLRFEKKHLAERGESLMYSWATERGFRFTVCPFEDAEGRAVLLTVGHSDDQPGERLRKWARQIANEIMTMRGAA